MYSCALWDRPEGGPRGDLVERPGDHSHELEDAQRRKIHLVLRRARVKPGDRILEFGSGWGGLAIVVCAFLRLLRNQTRLNNLLTVNRPRKSTAVK